MDRQTSPYGEICIGDKTAIFQHKVACLEKACSGGKKAYVGLTGGSTPKAFYPWCVEQNALSPEVLSHTVWCTSDERHVPLNSDDSNFGNADRLMLTSLNIPQNLKCPWPVELEAEAAADAFNKTWDAQVGPDRCFDLCLLGMGDDCHTASLFPQSPLIAQNPSQNFAAVVVPDKGWRLSITPAGLQRCQQVVITVTGSGKAEALKAVLQGEHTPDSKPVQLLRDSAAKVTWLIDAEAAALLG